MKKCLDRLRFKPFRHFFCGLSSKQPDFGIRQGSRACTHSVTWTKTNRPWHPRRTFRAAIPKPHDLSFCFNHRCIPRLKNHVLSYTKSTDFRDLSEARFRVSHGTVLTKRFLYLLRATFYPDKLFWTEPPKPSFQGAVRPLGFRDGLFNSNVKPT
jgi:hypothetical protein